MRQIFLDTETTGLEHKLGWRIIEIGCLDSNHRCLPPTIRCFCCNYGSHHENQKQL